MHATLKTCDGCGKPSLIWKTVGRKRYCKYCAPKKQKTEDNQYSKLREKFFSKSENQFCKAHLDGCMHIATDVHHSKGRGEYLLDTSTWIPVCRACHNYIETHPEEAKALELSSTRLNIEG